MFLFLNYQIECKFNEKVLSNHAFILKYKQAKLKSNKLFSSNKNIIFAVELNKLLKTN